MADDQLDIPDQPMTENQRQIIAQNADWARTFAPSATNVAQRKRFQEALDTERHVQGQEQEQQFQNRLATDKGFRDLYFKDQNLQMQQARQNHDADLRQRKFEMEQQLFPLKMENERARIDVERSGMERALRKEALDAQIAKRSEDQTAEFENAISEMINQPKDKAINPHSKQFAEGIAKAYAANPYANKDVVNQWWKQAKIEGTVDDFNLAAQKLGITKDNMSVSLGPNGWTYSARAPVLHEDVQMRSDEHTLDSLRSKLQDVKNTDPDYKAYLTERIQKVESRIKGAAPVKEEKPATAETVTGETKPAPSTTMNFTSGEEFSKAFAVAKPGDVLNFNGKPYTKKKP